MNGNGKQYNNGGRTFFGLSRSEKKDQNILGYVNTSGVEKSKKYRSDKLEKISKYLSGTQYNGLQDWDSSSCSDDHVPLFKRKPKIIYPFLKVYAERMASKLVGHSTFPKMKIEQDPEAEYFSNIVLDGGFIKPRVLDAIKKFVPYNSVFVRYKIADGVLKLENYCSNYCYPQFAPNGQLESVEIKYVYDSGEVKADGSKIERWFKMLLSTETDILFDNPEYSESSADPVFMEVSRVDHGLGFVQGEWFSNGENLYSPDGSDPIACDIFGFIDAINYNLSQTVSATNYGLDPQLVISGMDEDEVESLIKSSAKAWLMGREGKADYLEINGSGVKTATETSTDLFKRVCDIARIVMLDPEKIAGSAQSGKAMEVLHGPMVELVNEMRPWIEKGLKSLMTKIISTILFLRDNGMETQFITPDGWTPVSLEYKIVWPPIFELTTQDKQQLVSLSIQASNANIISRDTALRWLQSQGVDFGVEDFELEQQKINTQQRFNTFF